MKSLDESKIDKNWKSFLSYRDRRLSGTQTGIPSIDRYLLGLGGLVVIQGETGALKSTLALQIVHHNLKLGNAAIMLDAENGDNRIKERLLCQANMISAADVKTADVDELKRLRAPLLDYKFHVHTESVKDHELLRSRIQECWDAYQRPIILLVDSLQAQAPVNDDQRVSLECWMYFLDSLKLAFEGKLTIIVTSEINRSSYQQAGAVGAAKGTNAAEYKAEMLFDLRNMENGRIKMLVGKNRDGAKGGVFELEKVLADPSNQNSFTFLVRDAEDIGI